MVATILSVETRMPSLFNRWHSITPESPTFMVDSVLSAACHLAKNTGAKAITGMTHRGYTAFQIAKYRPKANIFIFTDNRHLLTTLSLIWGVRGFYYDRMISTDGTVSDIKYALTASGHLQKGDVFINTASMPINEKGKTNLVKVSVA